MPVTSNTIGEDGALIRHTRQAWAVSGLAFGVALVAFLLFFHSTVTAMVATWWHSATYQHSFLIPLIVAFLIWERRVLFTLTVPKPAPAALALLFATGFLWLLGSLVGALVVQEYALVLSILALAVAIFGWQVARALGFAFAFLLFAVPFGDFLIQPLQNVTADMTVWMLKAIGIPTFREGVFISTPSGDFHVAEACSGVRFLVAMLPLGVLFANIAFKSPWRRAAVMVLAIVVPIVANGFRAFGIIYIAYLTDNEYAVGVDHLVYGWLFFSVVMVVLIALGMLFSDKPLDAPAADYGWIKPVAVVSSWRLPLAVAGLAMVIAAFWALAGAKLMAAPETLPAPVLAAPVVSEPWQPVAEGEIGWTPQFLGAAPEIVREYERASDRARVIFYYGYYSYQREGAALIQYGNTLSPGKWDWNGSTVQKTNLAGQPLAFLESRIADNYGQRRVWSWYWTAGQRSTSPLVVKLLHLWSKLSGGDDTGAVIAISTEEGYTPDQAARTIEDFLNHVTADLPGLSVN